MSPAENGGGNTLADIHRVVEVGLTEVRGRLDVILSRLEQQDKRADRHEEQITGLDTRLDAVERDKPNREDTEAIKTRVGALESTAVTRADMDARQAASARTITIVVSIVALIISAGVSIGIAILT